MGKISWLLFLVCFGLSSKAQDPAFTQYFSSPVYLNPAFAGFDGCSRISTAYRNQWPAISGNYQTANAWYDRMIGKTHGVAVNYQFDLAGETIQTHSLSFVYAPAIRLFKNRLVISPALQLGWQHKYVDFSQLTFGDMIDPRYGHINYLTQPIDGESSSDVFDMSAGLLIFHSNFTYGAAFHHLTQPNEGLNGISKLPIKYTAHISYVGVINDHYKISPAFIFMDQQDFSQLQSTLTVYLYGARIGAGFRSSFNNPDAVLFMLGYQGHGFRVGYSYDYTVSGLANSTGGSHEATLAYVFNCINKAAHRKGTELIGF
ncbi:MAG: PorP/SprF family type IX secretion system membrane protein [Flavobacteriales bacterium]|nr:PorP/SprF family type IX secretion system membrane protein [Flavobacteriales bacterium]